VLAVDAEINQFSRRCAVGFNSVSEEWLTMTL
jgi:hypothetical protein